MKQEKFLEYGVHIGTLKRKAAMDSFVYKVRSDGLAVLDVEKVSERLGRFMPGTLTNPDYKKFTECDLLIASDPLVDRQAVTEANQLGIPVVAFCDTNNTKEAVDLIVPGNNKGKKSLAFLYWALATHILRERGELQKSLDLDVSPEEFQ